MARRMVWLGLVVASTAFAQVADPAAESGEAPIADASAAEQAEADADGGGGVAELEQPPQPVVARIPTQGRPLSVRRGFFTETNIGAFFTVGGNDAYSNAQSYLQLGVGYDVLETIELGAHVAFGANAFNCFAGRAGDGSCTQSDAFTITFVNLSVAYLHRLADRLYLTPRLVGGYSFLDPAPIPNVWAGPNLGVGVGVEYATSMDHFSIGADVIGRYILRANIPAISIVPRVKYTF